MKWFVMILTLTCACNCTQAQVNNIATIAGNDTAGFCCDGEPAINAQLNYPNQSWIDHNGNLYISDAFNHRIRKIILSTGIISTIAGTGIQGFSGDGGLASDAQ